jgi:VanZ like family
MVVEQLPATRKKRRLGILCGITITAILAATLWPFNPLPPNQVRWLTEANGISFDGPGLVISDELLRAGENLTQQSCTLELLLRPAAVKSLYTILSFYTPNHPGQFLVRQWTDGLLVSHDVADDRNKMIKRRKIDVDHAFEVGKILLVTIVSGPNGTVVYKNGRQAKFFRTFTISPSELSGQIVMGTSPVEYQPWLGEVRGLAIYSSGLTPAQVFEHYKAWTEGSGVNTSEPDTVALYRFTERAGNRLHNAAQAGPDLEIPKNFTVPHKALLKSPVKEFEASWGYVKDILLNVGGFVPLGFVVCAYLALGRSRGKAVFFTIFAAGMLSIAIEILQAYIPRRFSGTTDIITNTLGATLGAALAHPGAVRRFLGVLSRDTISQ